VPATVEVDATQATASAYREHADTVWGLLGRLGVAPEDREDALQEVFLVVHRGWARFEGRSALATWIHGITVRIAIAHRRRRGNASRRTTALDRDPVASDPDPHEGLERLDAARVLDRLLDELELDKRTVFVLSDVQGLTVPAIAEMLALNVRTAYSRLRVARADFDRALQRWQARRAHIETPPPALAQLRQRAHEAAPRRTWMAIAAAMESVRAPIVGSVLGSAGASWAAVVGGAAAAIGFIVVLGAIAWPRARGDASPAASVATSAPAPDSTPAAEPPRREAGAASLAASDPPASSLPPPTPSHGAESRAASQVPRPDVEAVATDTTATQVELLRRARASLRAGAAAQALALLDEHARTAEKGPFAAERELLRVEALCGLGRADEAKTAARAWATAHAGTSADEVLAQRCP
jgi:RNA polymerase sigma-70 factor (ECF subfamily)